MARAMQAYTRGHMGEGDSDDQAPQLAAERPAPRTMFSGVPEASPMYTQSETENGGCRVGPRPRSGRQTGSSSHPEDTTSHSRRQTSPGSPPSTHGIMCRTPAVRTAVRAAPPARRGCTHTSANSPVPDAGATCSSRVLRAATSAAESQGHTAAHTSRPLSAARASASAKVRHWPRSARRRCVSWASETCAARRAAGVTLYGRPSVLAAAPMKSRGELMKATCVRSGGL